MRYSGITRILSLLAFFLVMPVIAHVHAATLDFDAATKSVNVGDVFNLTVVVKAGTEQVRSSDAYISFDPAYVEPQSNITTGGFFSIIFNTINTNYVYVAGMENTGSTKTGTGNLATIPFKAKKSGSVILTYICGQGGSTDSTIIKASGSTNIIDCNANGKSTITIAGAGGTTPTVTPTPVGGSSTTPTVTPTRAATPTVRPTTLPATGGGSGTPMPTALPQSGIPANMTGILSIGTILLLFGISARMLL